MNKGSKRVGVKDIAAKAGVSIGTVDRVLNKRGEVKKETRENVLRIVDELGYKPNVFARSLSSKKTTRIAIAFPSSSDNNPYWEKPVLGVKRAIEELSSYNISISYEHFNASDESSYCAVLEELSKQEVDGIILNPVFKSASLPYFTKFAQRNIPYAFIDININGVDKLSYFGQDALQSGKVAASLMKRSSPAAVLVIKLSNKKVFSEHIEGRVQGFLQAYKAEVESQQVKIDTVEIDLQEANEPADTLKKVLANRTTYQGILVPNSRVFRVADFLEQQQFPKVNLVGYDLVDQNVMQLKKGNISFLISQKPEEQAYNAIMAMFKHLVTHEQVPNTSLSPIDILIKENIDTYQEARFDSHKT